MIKRIKDFLKSKLRSLHAGMFIAIIFATLLGVVMYFIVRGTVVNWIENDYNSQESRAERYDNYVNDLQTFVSNNGILSTDTAKITRWVRGNRNLYLFLYKDNQLFYDGSLDDSDTDKNPNTPDDENNSTGEDGDDAGEQDKPSSDKGNSGGITVDYPTREEIIAQAERNGLQPIDFSDGTLFVSFVDFTEYVYYDVANIASLVAGFATLAVVLMLYFHSLTTKISRLARDVSDVYEHDLNTKIRVEGGDNEFAKLTRNVEQMRTTMLDSLEKEKEALSANSELITSMSHDIRTPLTVLLGYLNVMKGYTSDEVMSEYIKASENTAIKLKDLSDDLFRYFLVFGDNSLCAELSDYGAKTLTEQLLSEHVLLLAEKGYDVKTHTGKAITDKIRILTDAPKLARVVDNLFSNIYKYADPSAQITVAVGLNAGRVEIIIKNKINDNTTGAESNKIGLKTCKKLCELLDIDFSYGSTGIKTQRSFFARLKLPVSRKETEQQ